MPPKHLSLRSANITRFFWIFILLLAVELGIYGYNYTNAYLNDKQRTLQTVGERLQKRIDTYRYLTYQIYDRYSDQPLAPIPRNVQQIKLRQNMFYVFKPHKKTDVLIYGTHDTATLNLALKISSFLDNQWVAKTLPYSMYYLYGQDNSLVFITTQSMQQQDVRLKENDFYTALQQRRTEMLQQANTPDERESYSNLRKSRNHSEYYFSLRTTFNNPGDLAMVIAFDLPISDLMPLSMARDNFQLTSNSDSGTVSLNGWMLKFSTPLSNAALDLIYHVPLTDMLINITHHNVWLMLIHLLLLAMSVAGSYFIRQQYIHPSENMAEQLYRQQLINQEIMANLSLGLLIYNFTNDSSVVSNRLADQLLPYLSLDKLTREADEHHGVVQATVNKEYYKIRVLRSQIAAKTYLFLMYNQDKEAMVNKRLQQARREFEKNLQARKLMLHNLGIELNQPLIELHQLSHQLIHNNNSEDRPQIEKKLWLESKNALTLVDNLTLLTRLETEDWQPLQQQYSVAALVDELLLAALPKINQKGLLLLNHFQLSLADTYLGDPQTVKKILTLLLDHAIVATSLGKITLTSEHDAAKENQLIFQITDTGSGLSPQQLSNLNYPFFSQALVDRFNHGSGLTFYLCNQLCKKLGGQLEIRSKIDIGTGYRVCINQTKQPEHSQWKQEKLLDEVTMLVDITADEVRSIVTNVMHTYGAQCLINHHQQPDRQYDLLLTDNAQRSDRYTLLLTSDEIGFCRLEKRYIRVNYNIGHAMLNATLQLIEQRLLDETADELGSLSLENSPNRSNISTISSDVTATDIACYVKLLRNSDYFQLFVDTVPEDIEKLYNENQRRDFTALSQTAHRLKGVFAMLNLTLAKHLCEKLEQHLAAGEVLMIADNINQIDSFVSRLLQQGS